MTERRCPECDVLMSGINCYECGWVDPTVKLRRRVEDVLRKSTPEVVEKVAQIMGVK